MTCQKTNWHTCWLKFDESAGPEVTIQTTAIDDIIICAEERNQVIPIDLFVRRGALLSTCRRSRLFDFLKAHGAACENADGEWLK